MLEEAELLDDRVGRLRRDAAVVVPVAGHLDVAIVAPGRVPGVLHQPVVARVIFAVAHRQHPVIQERGRALLIVVDSLKQETQYYMLTGSHRMEICYTLARS